MTLIEIVDELVYQYIAVHGQGNWGYEVDLPEKLINQCLERLMIRGEMNEVDFRNPNRTQQLTLFRALIERLLNEDAARRNLLFTLEIYKVGAMVAIAVRIDDLSLIPEVDELDVKVLST